MSKGKSKSKLQRKPENEPYAVLAKQVLEKHGINAHILCKHLGTSYSTAWRIVEGFVEPRSGTYQKLVELAKADHLEDLAA